MANIVRIGGESGSTLAEKLISATLETSNVSSINPVKVTINPGENGLIGVFVAGADNNSSNNPVTTGTVTSTVLSIAEIDAGQAYQTCVLVAFNGGSDGGTVSIQINAGWSKRLYKITEAE